MDLKDRTLLQQKQIITKPKIDNVINDFLNGDVLTKALDFIDYLKMNKMNPRWSATNAWTVKHKNKRVCITGTRESGKIKQRIKTKENSYV